MKRKSTQGWAEIIDFTESSIKGVEARASQLKGLLMVFQGHAQAGDPAPLDLLALARKERKRAHKRHKIGENPALATGTKLR